MKVLFAVNDEKSSAAIVKKYQKEYKEIISYKNVYYFNAILKEIQRDKTYDRIVISEDLEEFASNSYEQQDKYIFEKLDNISDEASNIKGDEVPIIIICSERRIKSEELLIKLFGIGIYDAIIGNDRSVDEVCRLIRKPRTKKEAKLYYKIDAEDVNYQTENENEVREEEMQSILNHFNKLGKNEERYVESFKNIISQYNDKQLRTIIAVLPTNVKAILETNSIEYQKLVMNGKGTRIKRIPNAHKSGPSEKFLNSNNIDINRNPIVVPTALNKNIVTKNANKQNIKDIQNIKDLNEEEFEEIDDLEIFEEKNKVEEVTNTAKRGRGRPRKNTNINENKGLDNQVKRKGRPKKSKIDLEENISNEFNNLEEEQNSISPGLENDSDIEENLLPGFENNSVEEETSSNFENDNDYEEILPGFDNEEEILPGFKDFGNEENSLNSFEKNIDETKSELFSSNMQKNIAIRKEPKKEYIDIDIKSLMSNKNKIVPFVGTSKNGISFTVNNIGEFLAEEGVDVAILDATKNKNSYYIYTQNEDELRSRAAYSINNLLNGDARGIKVSSNLSVYTTVPNQDDNIENYGKILKTLVKNHSLILIDCDFDTPLGYFQNAQEIYVVQSMDILTIQPLTAFLRELKAKNILSDDKIKIIINKAVRLKQISSKDIVGGIAYYNDPEMSFMTELFNKDVVKYIEVPFYQDIYEKYLDGIIECDISIKKYSKDFMFILRELAEMVYPNEANKNNGNYNGYKNNKKNKNQYLNGFSSSVNNTLNNMKKKY